MAGKKLAILLFVYAILLQDIGITFGSHSTPQHVHSPPPEKSSGTLGKKNHDPFVPSDPLDGFEPQPSKIESLIKENPYHDDFFASASDHFDSFNPDDFGPPKDFFSKDFSFDHHGGCGHGGCGHGGSAHGGSAHGGSAHGGGAHGGGVHAGGGHSSAPAHGSGGQETRFHNDYQGNEGKDDSKSSKKCETVTKEHMTCEVCKDDYGGFSEHCSHSLHSGKDQRYSNSKRNNNGNFNPNSQKKENPTGYGQESIATPKKTGPVYTGKHSNPEKQKHVLYDNDYDSRVDQGKGSGTRNQQFSNAKQHNSRNVATPPSSNSYQPNLHQSVAKQHKTHVGSNGPYSENPSHAPFDGGKATPQQYSNHNQPSFHHSSFQHFRVPQHNNHFQHQPQTRPNLHHTRPNHPHRSHNTHPTEYTNNFDHPTVNFHTSQFTQPETHFSHPSPKSNPHNSGRALSTASQRHQPPHYVPKHRPSPLQKNKPNSGQSLTGAVQDNNAERSLFVKAPTTGNQYRNSDSQNNNYHQRTQDAGFGKESNYDPFPDGIIDPQGASSDHAEFVPLNPEKNFQHLGKMMKEFGKKDRSNCEKIEKKNGMTCYQCKNEHNHIDEECMYESDSPKDGIHLMWTEETSY